MRIALFALVGFAAAVLGQNTTSNATSSVPECAVTCVFSVLPSSPCAAYGVSNLTCICESTAFQSAYFNCQVTSCNATELQAAEQYGATSCAANGTPINITATPTGVTATPSGAASTTSTPASSTSSAPSTTSSTAAATSRFEGSSAMSVTALGLTIIGGVVLLF